MLNRCLSSYAKAKGIISLSGLIALGNVGETMSNLPEIVIYQVLS